MSDLQDALDKWDANKGMLTAELETIVEAARLVADPDYAAMFSAWWDNDHIRNDQERLTLALNAALHIDPPEET